jgi:uncharacterized protein (TIGR04255 family)
MRRNYKKAPIVEAMIDVRIEEASSQVIDALQDIRQEYESIYPHKEDLFRSSGQVQVVPGVDTTMSAQHEIYGCRFTTEDRKYIWQSRRDGFTLSHLSPYSTWEEFRKEATKLWSRYRIAIGSLKVTRIAVRYINQVNVEATTIDLKELFNVAPWIPDDVPQQLDHFFMQLIIPLNEIKSKVIINQTVVPPPRPDLISVILDFDVFRDEHIPEIDDEMWGIFDQLHDRENSLFESCITDKVRGIIS